MKRLYVKETFSDGQFYWKMLCLVYDNEALGILERCLQAQGLEIRVTEDKYEAGQGNPANAAARRPATNNYQI